jgi:hypothetical protein
MVIDDNHSLSVKQAVTLYTMMKLKNVKLLLVHQISGHLYLLLSLLILIRII